MLSDDDLNLAAGYVLGVLDEADRLRIEARLAAGEPELERATTEFSAATSLLAHAAAPAATPAELRQRVLAAARADRPEPLPARTATPVRPAPPAAPSTPATQAAPVIRLEPRRTWIERFSGGFAAAAAVLALVAGFLAWQQAGLSGRVRTLEAHSRKLEAQLVDSYERGRWLDVWSAPATRITDLGSTANGLPQLGGRAAYDPATQRAVIVLDHIDVPSGKDLQLWAVRRDGPASLGLVKAGPDGRAELRVERVGDLGSLDAFAVSLEPAGGSPEPGPSGPVVLVGRLPG